MAYALVTGRPPGQPRQGIGDGGGGGGGARGAAHEEAYRAGAGYRQQQNVEREERRREGDMRTAHFQQTLEIEEKRRKAGSKEKNYISFLNVNNDRNYTFKIVAKMMNDVGIVDKDVVAVTRDPYRLAATEVLLYDGVVFDINEVNRKLQDKGYPFEATCFGKKTDTVRIRGMPLATDTEEIAKHIKDAVKPFVAEVHSIVQGKWFLAGEHRDNFTDRYFNAKGDGSYTVQVTPKEGAAIPGFIPVGPNFIQGQVEYLRGGLGFERLCNLCFKSGHFRGEPGCQGGEGWMKYAETVRQGGWEVLREQGEAIVMTEEERLKEMIKKMEADLVKMTEEGQEMNENISACQAEKENSEKSAEEARNRKNEEMEQMKIGHETEIESLREQLTGREKEMGERRKDREEAESEAKRKEEQLEQEKEKLEEELEQKEADLKEAQKEARKKKKNKQQDKGKQEMASKVKVLLNSMMTIACTTSDGASFKELFLSRECKELMEEDQQLKKDVTNFAKKMMIDDGAAHEKLSLEDTEEEDKSEVEEDPFETKKPEEAEDGPRRPRSDPCLRHLGAAARFSGIDLVLT